MAFHDNLPYELAFTDEQKLTQDRDMQRLLPLLTTNTGGGGGGGGVAPTWLSNANLRQQSVLHLQPDSSTQTEDVREKILYGKRIIDRSDRNRAHSNSESEDLAEYKADILGHPLSDQLLSAHVSCLRIATPVDQLARIDAQMEQSQSVVEKYSGLANGVVNEKELDQFMTHYVLLLCALKEQLQQHVRVHAMEAVMACWELEECLQSLTGVSSAEGTGATMSDDEDDHAESNANLYEGGLDGADSLGIGPLVPTESERSLMERVRHELKHELKQDYKEKIVDVREEIHRKRRAGKLPGDTTSLLKAWWQSHSKWPYPSEEDKARLVQETGLELKQINNWFINQRKRNWHTNISSSNASKNKRKSAGETSNQSFK